MKHLMKRPRALVIDDQPQIAVILRPVLSGINVAMTYAPTLHAAEQKLKSVHYDVVLLDRNLPDGDGLELVPLIRTVSLDTKTIVLSEKAMVGYRVEGLRKGADDYISKPFSPEEVSARVDVQLRRALVAKDASFWFLGVQVFAREYRLAYDGVTRVMSPKIFRLLLLFVRAECNTLTREQIAQKLWTTDKYPASSTIDVAVKRLRLSLAGFPLTVETRYYVGYALVAKT